ncbi:hypothetical protein [Devosia ginsengisoli]|uniref:hypothetical protein n=1 Tax=Devosia ginsengisoli TaxID=400770 RepID=UPI0026F04FD9|nr:hypothetical protein [Devosia ginsengisoli]MCR6670706.1 hypothetical protein [Devosia ginsengisoli]
MTISLRTSKPGQRQWRHRDIAAANVVMRSKIQVWQIPSTVYRMMAVSYAELQDLANYG